MTSFSRFFAHRFVIVILIACACIAIAPVAQAKSSSQVDKHARKIEKRLAKYHRGAFLELDLRNDSVVMGTISDLSDASFHFTDADNNKTVTFAYADVDRVKKGTEFIGAGSESGHHVRLWVPVVIGAVAAGGAVAAYEATR